jgi:hypothetical protein
LFFQAGSLTGAPNRSSPFSRAAAKFAANIPKLNGTATDESEVRRLAAIIEDRNRSIEYRCGLAALRAIGLSTRD